MLGEDKLATVLNVVESLAESYGADSGVLLGRLAGEEGFLTEERLGKLAGMRGESLAFLADFFSEEELAEYADGDRGRMEQAEEARNYEGWYVDMYSGEEIRAYAYYQRAHTEFDSLVDNDLSTPVGAFCWAVLHVPGVSGWTRIQGGDGLRPELFGNLKVWHWEREAAAQGIELGWETPPVDGNGVFRRALLEATAPEVRSVVFSPGLPSVLRPMAEALYGVYDELLALPVRRVRPTVEEISGYHRLRGLTGEEIARIWPEEFELDVRERDREKYFNALEMLQGDEVSGLLNAECERRTLLEFVEGSCPSWVWNTIRDECEIMWYLSQYSCPLFPNAEDIRESELSDSLLPGCTIDEDEWERELERSWHSPWDLPWDSPTG